MTPFQAVYGRPPPSIPHYVRGQSKIQAVDGDLLTRDEILRHLKQNLAQAQQRMIQQANKRRTDIQFLKGDLVLVKLQPYRQATVAARLNHKISRRYFGPFAVKEWIGAVAYKLDLPPESRIHPTFHVTLQRAFKGDIGDKFYPLPEVSFANRPLLHPTAILAGRIVNQQGVSRKQMLVQWSHSQQEDATWEDLESFAGLYGIADLEDKVNFQERGSDNCELREVLIDIEPIQQLMREWVGRISKTNTEDTTKEEITAGGAIEPRRRKKPAWTRDFIMAILK